MDRPGDGAHAMSRAEGQRGPQPGTWAEKWALSPGTLRLHVYGILASIEAGHPGLITDAYLDTLRVETTLATVELCVAGLWERRANGYQVLESETMRVAGEVHRQLEDLSERCRASGGHRPDAEHPELCCRCAVRLG